MWTETPPQHSAEPARRMWPTRLQDPLGITPGCGVKLSGCEPNEKSRCHRRDERQATVPSLVNAVDGPSRWSDDPRGEGVESTRQPGRYPRSCAEAQEQDGRPSIGAKRSADLCLVTLSIDPRRTGRVGRSWGVMVALLPLEAVLCMHIQEAIEVCIYIPTEC